MSTHKTKPDPGALDRQHKAGGSRAVGRKGGAFAAAAAIGLVACSGPGDTHRAGDGKTAGPAEAPATAAEEVVPEVDYVIDLNTGVMMPLPRTILRSHRTGSTHFPPPGQYAASPDGSRLAYRGKGDDGTLQIFIAGVDGTGVRQVTQDAIGAVTPAWSPDGNMIAYQRRGSGEGGNIFVLDVATGESTQVTDEPCRFCYLEPVFTPDGSSIIYTGGARNNPVLRTVPVTGARSTLLFDRHAQGLGGTGGGSLSPDGSLLTFMGHEIGGPGALRFLANADGSDWRIIPHCFGSYPAGTWSPDGSRIVCSGPLRAPQWKDIYVVDIATGDATGVANGQGAIWLDDHTLLVSV